MAEQTVDDLEERLLHTGKALIQQLRDGERHLASDKAYDHKMGEYNTRLQVIGLSFFADRLLVLSFSKISI